MPTLEPSNVGEHEHGEENGIVYSVYTENELSLDTTTSIGLSEFNNYTRQQERAGHFNSGRELHLKSGYKTTRTI